MFWVSKTRTRPTGSGLPIEHNAATAVRLHREIVAQRFFFRLIGPEPVRFSVGNHPEPSSVGPGCGPEPVSLVGGARSDVIMVELSGIWTRPEPVLDEVHSSPPDIRARFCWFSMMSAKEEEHFNICDDITVWAEFNGSVT